jgi:hypothetical protein
VAQPSSIISGPDSTCVVMDLKNLEGLLVKIPKGDIAMTLDNLSELVVALSEHALTTPSVLAAIATELAINSVNLVTSVAPPRVHIFVVEESEVLNTYRAIEKLSRG